jgi:hypothetical protein
LGNASQFKKELTGAVAATNKANSGFQRMGRVAGVAGGILATGLAVGLAKAAKGAIEDQVAHERLTTAFKNAHVSADAFTKRIAAAEEAGRKLGFQDEQVTESLGSLVTATHSGTKAIQLNNLAMDAARFKHTDLAAGAKLLTSTLAGNTRAAKTLGIQLIPVTTNVEALRAKYKALGQVIPAAELVTAKYADKQATADLAVQKLTKAIGGQAEAFGGTAQGKLDVYNARMDELRDNIGKGVLPAVVAVTEKLSGLAAFMAKHTTLTKGLVIALGGLSAALLAASAASAIATVALSPILLPVAAAVVGIAALSFIVYKLVSDFRKNWPLLLPIVLGPLGAIIAAAIHWHSQIAGVFTAAWNAVKGITSAAWGAIAAVIRAGAAVAAGAMGALDTAANGVRSAFNAARSAAEAVAGFFRGALVGAFNAAKGVAGGVLGVVRGIADAFWAAVHAVEAFIGVLSKIHVPHISLPHINLPHIPGTATGGIITSPQVRLVGEAGPEAIVPLSKFGGSFRGGGGGELHIHFDGPVIGNDLDSAARQLAVPILREFRREQARNVSLGFT